MKANQKYLIKAELLLLRDEASIKRHIKQNDYFGTIATIISLLHQQLSANGTTLAPAIKKSFANLEKDLKFLQDNYRIIPEQKKTKASLKPRTGKLGQTAG